MQLATVDHKTQIAFGAGCFQQIAGLIGGRRYGVVTYGEPYFADLTTRLSADAGAPVIVVDDVAPNPDFALLAKAALTAGLAFSHTKTAIAHSVSYPISLNHGVVHGIACSFSLPIVLQSMADQGGLAGKSLKAIFGDNLGQALQQMIDFLGSLGVSAKPVDYGIDAPAWRDIVTGAFAGERGLNFIGNKDDFLRAGTDLGLV